MERVKVVQKQGLVSESGDTIIPVVYDSVKVLKSGVYVAEIKELHQFFEKEKSRYEFYTSKRMIDSIDYIWEYRTDEDENVVAVRVYHGWMLLNIDYEKNILDIYASKIVKILDIANGYISVIENTAGKKEICLYKEEGCVYKIDTKKEIFSSSEISDIKITEKGFIVTDKNTNNKGFIDFEGKKILDCIYDHIICFPSYMEVFYDRYLDKKNGQRVNRMYSYEGKELLIE